MVSCLGGGEGSISRKPGGGDGGGAKVLCLIIPEKESGGGKIADFYDGGGMKVKEVNMAKVGEEVVLKEVGECGNDFKKW